MSNLISLDLRGNQLSGAIPPELGNLSKLRLLYLFDNQLTGSIPVELGNLGSLEELRLNSNMLCGSLPASLADLSALTIIDLSYDQLTLTDDESLAVIEALQNQGATVNIDGQQPMINLTLQLKRCNPDAYENLNDAAIDDPLVPVADEAVLGAQPTVDHGLVADGVTPLLVEISSPSDSGNYEITFDALQGGSIVEGLLSHVNVLQNGSFQAGTTLTFPASGPAYVYISALKPEDVTFDSTEITVMMHVTNTSNSEVGCGVEFRIRLCR